MKNISCLAVFCGSLSGKSKHYTAAAKQLGEEMHLRGIDLVYGGGSTGIMGELATTLLENGSKVTGVIPNFLYEREVGKENVTELIKVDTMHVRKQTMYDRAEGFVILPGGLGTLEECFEVISWKQLKLHKKPIILLNVGGCWNNFNGLIESIVQAEFVHENINELFTIVDDVKGVFSALDEAERVD